MTEFENDDSGFEDLSFATNPDPRCQIILVLDNSDSMAEKFEHEERSPLDALNGGLDTLVSALHRDPLAQRRAEISFVTYGTEVNPATDFKTVDEIVLPTLSPMGVTSTGTALIEALDALEERKKELDSQGIARLRPLLIFITDGLATDTDKVPEASRRLREAHELKKVTFLPIAVEGADMDALYDLAGKTPLKLQGLKFDSLFEWVSASATAVSASQPGDTVQAPPPNDWAEL